MSDDWRETQDPDELAAAVAAGVTVEYATGPDSWSQTNAPHIGGARYRVPALWVYEPESEWRESTDPNELAAAVAAGVAVEVTNSGAIWVLTKCRAAEDYRSYIQYGFRYRVPAWWEYESPRADAAQLLRDLQDAACSVMARPDVLGMLHGQTRHGLSDLVVDLAMALHDEAAS